MATEIHTAPRITSVAVRAGSPAGGHYRSGRENAARAPGFSAHTGLNLHNFGGKTIESLTFHNVYVGGYAAWSIDDVNKIDASLAAAMTDAHLNNVLAQYYRDGSPTTTFKGSRELPGPVPSHVYRDTVESFVAGLDQRNALHGFDLGSTVFCFMLPRGVVLVDGDKGSAHHSANLALRERDEAADSKHGLGGFHGSVHAKHGGKTDTVYYAVGVYSEGSNGIVAFDQPWKNICATFYHELCEARTDADVEDAIRAGNSPNANSFLGWYSPRGGEIGDIPIEEAGPDIELVMKEVPLVRGGTAPIQLMWSNAVGGPEGPIAKRHPSV